MAVMPKDVQDLFTSVFSVTLSTASPDGRPNAAVVAMKCVVDDETVYLSDQFFKKTFVNLQENPRVAITFFDKTSAYQIHGTARYVSEGEEFEKQAAWVNAAFEQMGKPVKAKGGIYVTVDAVYEMGAGPNAGDKIA